MGNIAGELQKGLVDAGFNIGVTNTPVTPVYMNGSIPEATNMVIDLRENFGYLLFNGCLSGNS
jgi:glycine C-acetyltransferase